jgi:hypothetical protein
VFLRVCLFFKLKLILRMIFFSAKLNLNISALNCTTLNTRQHTDSSSYLRWHGIQRQLTWDLALNKRIISEISLGHCLFVRPRLVSQIFFPKTSHRIFGHMHEALNIDKKKTNAKL